MKRYSFNIVPKIIATFNNEERKKNNCKKIVFFGGSPPPPGPDKSIYVSKHTNTNLSV